LARVSRTWGISAGRGYCASITVPPVKSSPRFMPRTSSEPTAIRSTMTDQAMASLRQRKKSMLVS